MEFRRFIPAFLSALALAIPTVGLAQSAPAPAADLNGSPGPYILGPQDVIDVEIPGRQDFKVRARIGPDGQIEVPYLHAVTAAGRTPRQLGDELARALDAGGFYSHPVVLVEVEVYASRNVTVLGAVGTPGVVPIDRPYHVSEVLARVGGARNDAADYVQIRSADGKEKKLAIKALATGGIDEDPYVLPGDKLFIPKAELFYVSGQVKSPGAYPVWADMTVRMALAQGGGVTDQGSENRIKVTRGGRPVHLSLDAKIQPGDVIVVGERLF